MNRTKHALIISLFASTRNGNKHYTKAAPDKLQSLLKSYHAIDIKRRWLFKCLSDMENAGYIRRKKRFRNIEEGKIRQYSSMITFTLEGIKYLVSKKIEGANLLLKKMLSWLKSKDKRFPKSDDIFSPPPPEIAELNLQRLKLLMQNLT
jgi:hypothetical protein